MPIPNVTEATVAPEKVRDYLLNPEHPDGGSKAVWFQSLGYARDRGRSRQAISWPWPPYASNVLTSTRRSA